MKITLREDKESEYLIRDMEYTVFAVYLSNPIEFMIHVNVLPAAPFCISSDDVEVVDNRLSKYWVFKSEILATINSNQRPAVLAFSEWANDVYFYQNIVDGAGSSGKVWQEYKKKMEYEYAPPNLTKAAVFLDNGWLQCADCSEAWIPEVIGELVSCPLCSAIQKWPQEKNCS